MIVGVLALQGNFALHQKRLEELGVESREIRCLSEIDSLNALIIPGGESTTLLKLLDAPLRDKIVAFALKGFPVLLTCAGLIIGADRVYSPQQTSLGMLDVDIERNSYGRQVDSFVEPCLLWTKEGKKVCLEMSLGKYTQEATDSVEGIFIRAPRITRVGQSVKVLIKHGSEPVLVMQKNILGATFHPELSSKAFAVHKLLIALAAQRASEGPAHRQSA